MWVILGMHRSGTSAVTGFLHRYGGAHCGSNTELMAPARDNAKGFFEAHRVMAINDRALQHIGRTWETACRAPHPCDAGVFERVPPLWRADMQRWISSHVQQAAALGKRYCVKDPRMCATFALWQQAARKVHEPLQCVLVFRNPEQVARSLHKRNGTPLEDGLRMWHDYNVCVLAHAATAHPHKPCVAVHYGKLRTGDVCSHARTLVQYCTGGGGPLRASDEEIAAWFSCESTWRAGDDEALVWPDDVKALWASIEAWFSEDGVAVVQVPSEAIKKKPPRSIAPSQMRAVRGFMASRRAHHIAVGTRTAKLGPPANDGAPIALCFHVYQGHHQDAIWERWLAMPGAEHFDVFVHAKDGTVREDSFLAADTVVKAPVRPTKWAKTQLAKHSLLRSAMEHGRDYRHFVHLSDSCIPLLPPDAVYERLSCIPRHCSTIMHGLPGQDTRAPYRKYLFRFGRPVVRGIVLEKLHTHTEWIVLSRKHAQLLVDWEHTAIGKAMLRAPCVDNENYPLSVLHHAGEMGRVLRVKTHHADWTRSRRYSGHPYSWMCMAEQGNMARLKKLQREQVLFCRKFPQGSDIGDYIDALWAQ